jgi:hypothetical protein
MTRLSLAVAAPGWDRADVERYLSAIRSIGLDRDDEVIIAATLRDPIDARPIESAVKHASAVRLSIHGAELSLFRLWGIAMSRANGSHVAVLDGRDAPSEGWANAWASAPRDRIVCGPVDPDVLGSLASWACYFSEYGQFLSPLERIDEVPGNNLVFPRSLLPPADELASHGFWKTFHLASLEKKLGALPMTIEPQMIVRFQREYSLVPYLYRRFLHGRCYGGRRLDQPGAPSRLLCLAFTPLLPALRTGRVLRRVLAKPKKPVHLLTALPGLVMGEVAWAFGEGFGYARGPSDACDRVT